MITRWMLLTQLVVVEMKTRRRPVTEDRAAKNNSISVRIYTAGAPGDVRTVVVAPRDY